MSARNIVIGQAVAPAKVQRAKELRRKMTAAEAVLWRQLRGNRLHGLHFRRQQVIDGFIVDFYCHAAAVVVEVDGEVHRGQVAYDREREEILKQHGLHVLRTTNAEVAADLAGVLARIARACGREPNPPAPFPTREGGGRERLKSSVPPSRFGKGVRGLGSSASGRGKGSA
jgi:very-short-patch-repair endonuclease